MPATDSRRRTLRSRLGVAFAVATLVPALGIVALHAILAARQARADADATLRRAVSQLHARVDSHLDQQIRSVTSAAEALAESPLRPIAGRPEPAGLAAWLDRQAAGRPAFESLFVTDADGRVAAVSPSGPTVGVAPWRRVLADRDYVREPMRGELPFLSGLFLDPQTGTPVLVAASPIPGAPGQPGGVVGGVLRLSAFETFVRDHRVASAEVQVLDPSGFQVATTDTGGTPSRSPSRAAALAPLVAASRPVDGRPSWYAGPSGDEKLAAVLESTRGWRTAVVLPRRAVYAGAWQSTITALLAVAGGVVLAGSVAVPLARRALRPLEILVAAAEDLVEGEELAPVAGEAPAEVARLSADFSRMAARATAIRATLEQEVVTRTAELSEARDRAEREARLKSVFLAAMSHEIRTPMNSIVGMAELMAETPLDGEQREYCDTIRTSTDALLGVINDVLDFSKFEAQGVTLETLDFDLRVVVEEAVDLLAVKAATSGLDLAAVVEPGFDGRFRGDPSRLRQVIVNLLGNAIKFTARGSVVVRVATVGGADGPVRIAVTDTGIGMTPEGLSRLFRPFSQAEDSTARQYGGTGLGLTISKQIVEKMGGVIGVESTPGRGSTFFIEVPLARGAALPAASQPLRSFADAVILEPRDASAEALQQLLVDVGIQPTRVATAGDGLGALDARVSAGRRGFALAFVSVDAIDAAPFVDALQQHASAAATALVAIVPAGRRAGPELDRFGPAPRLTRPLRRARLVEALDVLAGEQHLAPAPRPSAPLPAVFPAAPDAEAPAGAARILVADDYFANQRLVTRLLERRGYVVEAVGDGQSAVDAVLARRFDVVLMDCNMPLLDGYAATAQIRALEGERRTPILAMTANDSPEDRDTCLQAGMDDYLVKPIQAAIVLAAIERWVAAARPPLAPAGPGIEEAR